MTTEPKPVKPLVAFAAVRDGVVAEWAIRSGELGVKIAFNGGRCGGWRVAQEDGYRIIKVRIEPVEE